MLFQELPRGVGLEQRVACLQAKEKSVARRQGKARHVEDRMMRPGQSVKPEHRQHGRKRRRQDRQLERDRDERRPAIKWPPADIERVVDRRREPLHEEAADSAE